MTTPAKLLSNRGLRVTVGRLAVLELVQAHARLAPLDIFRRLDDGDRRLSLATIHRVLAELRDAGLVERHYLADGKASYSPARAAATAHLVCRACGAAVAIDDAALDRRFAELAAGRGFVLAGHTVSLHGVCAHCAAAEPAGGAARRRGPARG